MQRSGLVTNRDELVTLEFQQLSTSRAIEMVVLGVTVIMVVNRSAIELKTVQQSGVNAFTQRPIDCRRTDIVGFTASRQPLDQFFGIEMIVLAEHLSDQKFSLTRLAESPRLEVLAESFLRRKRNLQRFDFRRNRVKICIR